MADVVAIITGERGHREIVRPLAAVGLECAVLDWEKFRAAGGSAHARFIPAVWTLIRAHTHSPVFTDMSSAFLLVILAVARLHGARVLLRLRGDPYAEVRDQMRFHWNQRQWPQLLRAWASWLLDGPLFSQIDHFVPVSEWIVRRMAIGGRSSVVRVPIEVGAFPSRKHIAGLPLHLLAVTNFDFPKKVAALGRFLEQYGNFLAANEMRVTIAGKGIAWEDFRKRHEGRAEFLGFVRDVAGLYASHDAFVHFSDLDAFPYVVLEAQAAGLPVIVNCDCGMLEQVGDEENGFLVDLDHRVALEALLLRLRDNVELRKEIGARARDGVRARYALTAIGTALKDAMKRAGGSLAISAAR